MNAAFGLSRAQLYVLGSVVFLPTLAELWKSDYKNISHLRRKKAKDYFFSSCLSQKALGRFCFICPQWAFMSRLTLPPTLLFGGILSLTNAAGCLFLVQRAEDRVRFAPPELSGRIRVTESFSFQNMEKKFLHHAASESEHTYILIYSSFYLYLYMYMHIHLQVGIYYISTSVYSYNPALRKIWKLTLNQYTLLFNTIFFAVQIVPKYNTIFSIFLCPSLAVFIFHLLEVRISWEESHRWVSMWRSTTDATYCWGILNSTYLWTFIVPLTRMSMPGPWLHRAHCKAIIPQIITRYLIITPLGSSFS